METDASFGLRGAEIGGQDQPKMGHNLSGARKVGFTIRTPSACCYRGGGGDISTYTMLRGEKSITEGENNARGPSDLYAKSAYDHQNETMGKRGGKGLVAQTL